MASTIAIFTTFLVFISSICAALHEVIPSNFLLPPAGISLQALNSDGNGRFPVATSIAFINNGNPLSIDCSNFHAYTDSSWGFFENRGCELVLQVTYPPNCPFYVHDPEFDGNITLGASDAFDAFSFFGPWLPDTSKIVFHSGI
jgi:hypothetical protein